MTDQQTKDYIAALLREREGYVRYGHEDRAAEVDAELARLGHGSKPPAKRATRLTPKERTEL